MQTTDYLTLRTDPRSMTDNELQQAQELLTRASGSACRSSAEPDLVTVSSRLYDIERELIERTGTCQS